MMHISQLKDTARISPLDRLEVEKYYLPLLEQQIRFEQGMADCCQLLGLAEKSELLLKNYYPSLIKGVYQNNYYTIQYQQALHWLTCGLTFNQCLLMLTEIQHQFVLYANALKSDALAKSLLHVVGLGQSIVTTVYSVAESIERMKAHSNHEIRRIKNSYCSSALEVSQSLIDAYINHQKWKMSAFELALDGQSESENYQSSYLDCNLAVWLKEEGLKLIPEAKKQYFLDAHERVHRLANLVIEEATQNRHENISQLLMEMEMASEDVMDVLLDLIEKQFVEEANTDSLTGFLNRRAFDFEFDKALAFAKRHDFWLDLVVIDVDHFKQINDQYGHQQGDAVLKRLAEIFTEVARTEDMIFRWGGEEFVVITLDKEAEGSEMLAERLREAVEKETFIRQNGEQLKLTISCGALSYWAGLSLSEKAVFELADEQLYLAKQNGRNQISHRVYDVVPMNRGE